MKTIEGSALSTQESDDAKAVEILRRSGDRYGRQLMWTLKTIQTLWMCEEFDALAPPETVAEKARRALGLRDLEALASLSAFQARLTASFSDEPGDVFLAFAAHRAWAAAGVADMLFGAMLGLTETFRAAQSAAENDVTEQLLAVVRPRFASMDGIVVEPLSPQDVKPTADQTRATIDDIETVLSAVAANDAEAPDSQNAATLAFLTECAGECLGSDDPITQRFAGAVVFLEALQILGRWGPGKHADSLMQAFLQLDDDAPTEPKALVSKALRCLGYKPEAFTNNSRKSKSRAELAENESMLDDMRRDNPVMWRARIRRALEVNGSVEGAARSKQLKIATETLRALILEDPSLASGLSLPDLAPRKKSARGS